MAKNNNLTDFLTGVADAIRTKKGTTDLINPQDFESEIASIETGGGGTSAVLGELNVSSNGTYEAVGKMTLVPGDLYQFKEQLPVETLAELYSATQGNNGEIFSIVYQEIPLTQLTIHKTDDIYILESSTFAKVVENIYSTGTTTFTYHSMISNSDVTVELTPGWNTFTPQGKSEVPVLSSIRLPQDISGIPGGVINLVDVQFDTSNCVKAIPDESSTAISIKNLGQFVKLTGGFDLTKRLSPVSLGNIDEFNIDGDLVVSLLISRSIFFSNLQDDIEGIKYFKVLTEPAIILMYVEDSSKIQVTSGTAENGCWYLAFDMYFGPEYPWTFAYEKELVDGYNKVTVNVPSQAKLQSKTATSNGVYAPDEGFDGLSQVTVDFALQDKTITANGTYTCDEGYGGLGQINVRTVPNLQDKTVTANGAYRADASYDGLNKVTVNVKPKLQSKTVTANGTYTAGTGYDGLKQVTVNVKPNLQDKTLTANGTYTCDEGYEGLNQVTVKIESRTLLNNGKLAVHTVAGTDNLSLDPNKATIEELIVNEGATGISNGTEYTNLERVVLPDTLKSIASGTFSKCANLESMTIPFVGNRAGVTASNNEQYPFGYIFGTSSYTGGTETEQHYYRFDTRPSYSTYYIPSSLKSVTVTGGNILYGAFYNCSGLTSITIPNNVTSIGERAFYNCSGLTSFTIPDSVTSIGDGAFWGCSSLTSITIPDGVTSIGNTAFSGCSGLTSVTIPNSVTSIGYETFEDCSGLTSVTIPNSVTSIGPRAFDNCSGLTSVTIPSGVTSIEQSVFSGCSGLTRVTIPDSVTIIEMWAFEYCSSLTSITIPNSVTIIERDAFSGCGVTSITIPDSVTSIGDSAFWGCKGLTSATIGNGVTSIGKHAFLACSKLTTVSVLATTPPTLGSDVFNNYANLNPALTQIIVPAGCGEAYKTDANWSKYAKYIIEEGMHRVILGENVTCSVEGTSYSNQTFDVADQTVIHFEVGQASEGGAVSSTPDGIFLNGTLVSSDSEPATYDLTVTGNVSVTYSTGDVVGDITYNNCYKIVMD